MLIGCFFPLSSRSLGAHLNTHTHIRHIRSHSHAHKASHRHECTINKLIIENIDSMNFGVDTFGYYFCLLFHLESLNLTR